MTTEGERSCQRISRLSLPRILKTSLRLSPNMSRVCASATLPASSQAFHKDAVMYGFTNGELLGGPIKNLYDFVEKNGTAPDIKTRLDVLAITPTTAVVRVDMENDAIGANYTDFHTLIKIDGTWQIIAKVYHMYEG